MRAFFFFVLLFSSSILQAEFRGFDNDPEALIGQSVDITTGALLQRDKDFVLESIEQVPLQRHYTSKWGKWLFFPHAILIQTEKGFLHTSEPNGTLLQLVKVKDNLYRYSLKNMIPNTSRGVFSAAARFHLLTAEIKETHIFLQTSSGSIREYEKSPTSDLGILCQSAEEQKGRCYRLISERLPSRNSYRFGYDRKGRLSSIALQNVKGITYATFTCKYRTDRKWSASY